MTDLKDDVCIVGGGPAGLALALLLLRSGTGVVVVERSRSLERSYRGEILQPGGLAVLGELGALPGVLERGAHQLSGFRLLAGNRVLMNIDYRRLPKPYNHLLSVPQQHVLGELLALCEAYERFTYLGGYRIRELVTEGSQVTGVLAAGEDGECRVHARCVVGADGRYSRTRTLAGIDAGRIDAFDQDVLWFKLLAPDRLTGRVQIYRAAGGAVIVHDSYPGRLQIGWTLPHRGYQAIAERGLDHVKEQLRTALPQYADLIEEQVTSLHDLTLLDVFAGCANEWARDGLVLIGDAAHTHGPLGAQGINLALQDAALLHPLLFNALRSGDVSAQALGEFARTRQPDVDRVVKMQLMQSRGMLAKNPVADAIRPVAATLIGRTPIGKKITQRIAFGNPAIRVHSELFVSD
jgi:monooxygenase